MSRRAVADRALNETKMFKRILAEKLVRAANRDRIFPRLLQTAAGGLGEDSEIHAGGRCTGKESSLSPATFLVLLASWA